MKLKILLVDDEPKVLKGLQKIINKANENWEIINTFKNGLDALEYIANNNDIDVVITDIKMPYMDGLELMKKVSDMKKNLQFIILSGYADFDYAQRAIALNTVEYILKPPDYNDIIRVLTRIENQKKTEEERINQENILKENLITLKENKLLQLMYMANPTTEKLNEYKRFQCFNEKFILVVIKIDNFSLYKYDEIDKHIAKLAAFRKQVEKCIYEINGYMIDLYNGTYFCFLNILNSNPIYIKKICDKIHKNINQNVEESIMIGISNCYNLPQEINSAYKECLIILRNKVFFPKNSIIYFDEIDSKDTSHNYPLELEHRYIELLKFGKFDDAITILENIITKLIDISHHDSVKFKNLVMEFIIVVSKSLTEEGSTIAKKIKEIKTFHKLSLLDNISDTKDLLYEYTIVICNYFNHKNRSGCRKIITEIKLYIEKNYFKDISLRKIANDFYMNESYLSDLFKKETGISFTTYITNIRMEQAKVLLHQLDLKTYEISEMVGYKNSRYFNKVFKKQTGFTPFEYRERMD